MNKLPEKTSALIRVALADLVKCEQDPLYSISMELWHSHATTVEGEPVCLVCLGGTVISQTMAFPYEFETDDVWRTLEDDTYHKERIIALDLLRVCAVVGAVEHVEGILPTEEAIARAVKLRVIEDCHRTLYRSYAKSPDAFKEWLAGIATELERAGF